MVNITLRQLETFMAVASAGGFRRAADQLYRSQSAVSAQIQQLEAALGVALFHPCLLEAQEPGRCVPP